MQPLAKSVEEIRLSDYEYILPEDRIAKFPLEKRDQSKLLQLKGGEITHHRFFDLPSLVPNGSLMVFNNTKVIPARMIFQRDSGAKIEIFLLKPIEPSGLINEVMLQTNRVVWECMIGNLKKWKTNEKLRGEILIKGKSCTVFATLKDRDDKKVTFEWDNSNVPFVSIVEAAGEVPLPPYLNRKPTEDDKPRYQTVYSQKEGAVAAPTAGLHFTEEVLDQLKNNGVKEEFLTLHVSAGTFAPVKEDQVAKHEMHSEQMVISGETIASLANHGEKVIAVGTTSMRTLESLYWYGVMLEADANAQFWIRKLFPYESHKTLPDRRKSFLRVLEFMKSNGLSEITGHTEIMIMPGYDFKVCDALITNFHQPSSTLILLVAAFTKGHWEHVYQTALDSNYRFLSYGDSSVLWR